MDRARHSLLLDIAAEFGTPVYVYDAAVLRRQLASLSSFDRVRFAQKACANLHVLRLLRSGGAFVDCVSPGELARALAAGFRALNSNPRSTDDDIRAAMEATGRTVAHKLERYLAALATIASAAPLLGLLGTVIGMIEIFGSQSPTGGAVGSGNPAQLAHGISVALYNTAFGLIVAIPTLIFWRYFRSRVDEYLLNLELASERFARHLEMLRG